MQKIGLGHAADDLLRGDVDDHQILGQNQRPVRRLMEQFVEGIYRIIIQEIVISDAQSRLGDIHQLAKLVTRCVLADNKLGVFKRDAGLFVERNRINETLVHEHVHAPGLLGFE